MRARSHSEDRVMQSLECILQRIVCTVAFAADNCHGRRHTGSHRYIFRNTVDRSQRSRG